MAVLNAVDRLSAGVGRVFAWLMVVLTGLIVWEVGSRYVFGSPHAWAFDAQAMAYGTLFMLAGAYTLATSGHVRGDVLYGFLAPRAQAAIDLVLYVVFFFPGVVALVWAGYEFASESWAIREHSSVMAEGPPIYPFKTVIPVAGAVLLLQGIAEIARCVLCLRDGAWPPRASDVKEIDVEALTGVPERDATAETADAATMRAREERR
jgi:TRAP-type mannitol/chloroaromatic compound transport system permease small subunit